MFDTEPNETNEIVSKTDAALVEAEIAELDKELETHQAGIKAEIEVQIAALDAEITEAAKAEAPAPAEEKAPPVVDPALVNRGPEPGMLRTQDEKGREVVRGWIPGTSIYFTSDGRKS